MVLGKIPLVSFLISCYLIYHLITKHKKERKAANVLIIIVVIGGFAVTIKNLNTMYFVLGKLPIILLDIIIFSTATIAIILAVYMFVKNDKEPYGKLPKIK